MSVLRLFAVFLALLAVGHAMAANIPIRRLALVIGNDTYQNIPSLKKSGNDATAMARELQAAGFKVSEHRNLNYIGMIKAVTTFTKALSGGEEVVVFFSGHGVEIRSGNYLLPIDIDAESESEIEKMGYELEDLTNKLKEARPSFSLVVVDACRDDPTRRRGTKSIVRSGGLSRIEPAKGQMVVYSASKGQEALDYLTELDENPNGIFTREFIARMKQPGLRVDDLMREVQTAVEELARTINREQRPAIYNEATGNFYFYRPTTEFAKVERRISDGADEKPEVLTPFTFFRDCPDCPEMLAIPAGRFRMGHEVSEATDSANLPEHSVAIRRSFAIGITEVTQGQWRALMGNNPSHFKVCGDECPVENVSWYDANRYIEKLNVKTGRQYRLPSEAEWEYVCNGFGFISDSSLYCFSSDPVYAWHVGNADGKTHPVAQLGPRAANTLEEVPKDLLKLGTAIAKGWLGKGIFDLNGNVWEWTQDCWVGNYSSGPLDERPITSGDCGHRVVRGGSWEDPRPALRRTFRDRANPLSSDRHIGFRVARSIAP